MLPKISSVMFGQRAEVKSLLATLLPDLQPTARLELLAHQAGHRSDAAMSAYIGPDPEPRDILTELAAHGRVLPLLVYASLAGVRATTNPRGSARPRAPQVSEILRAGEKLIVRKTFRECLIAPFEAALEAPAGACRWFFAVAASNVAFAPEPGVDRFWLHRGCVMSSGILGLMEYAPEDVVIDEALLRYLAECDVSQSLWEQTAQRLLKETAQTPAKTLESVIATVQVVLDGMRDVPETGILPGGSWA